MLKGLREEVYQANMDLVRYGLVTFTWGNVSGIDRASGCFVIKPSGVEYERLRPENLVVVDLDGRVAEGELRPSSDTATHLELYRAFANVGGIVHTHSKWATAWAQAVRDIPCYGTTHADYFHGAIPCVRPLTKDEIDGGYEQNTGKLIVQSFRMLDPATIPAALCANHGPFAWGGNASEAVHNAVVLETVAEMAARSEGLNNRIQPAPQHLLDKHYLRKHGQCAYYGQSGGEVR